MTVLYPIKIPTYQYVGEPRLDRRLRLYQSRPEERACNLNKFQSFHTNIVVYKTILARPHTTQREGFLSLAFAPLSFIESLRISGSKEHADIRVRVRRHAPRAY